mgnify:CR=1 FL=1
MMRAVVVRLGDHRYAVATDYGQPLGMGRSGVWVPQQSGGWWVGAGWVEQVVDACPDPVVYRTMREAMQVVEGCNSVVAG